jgi:O-acetyl-ADP-ribose deacetylase (regulator of RNase III)
MNRTENLDYILRQLMIDNGHQYTIPTARKDKQQMMRALMNIRQPIPVSQEFLAVQDEELRLQAEEKGVERLDGEGILLWQGDITRLKVDAIVNAANAQGLGCWAPLHNCIDNCIHSAAGIQLRKECNDQLQGRLLKTGEAMMTKGYNLPAGHVIHTVGPIVPQGSLPTKEQEEELASCYHSCLDIADSNHLESIAFCCISTGVFNFPNQRAAEIAIATVKQWIAAHQASSITQVVFNVFLDKDYEIYQRLLSEN